MLIKYCCHDVALTERRKE